MLIILIIYLHHQTTTKLFIMNYQMTVIMFDELNEKSVTRTICATNAFSNGAICWELKDEKEQRANIERWISERANEQHETILSLTSWTIHKN